MSNSINDNNKKRKIADLDNEDFEFEEEIPQTNELFENNKIASFLKRNPQSAKPTAKLIDKGKNEVKMVSFWNFKGGVGKTTSCLSAAYAAVAKGKKVLLVDADPQKNLTQMILRYHTFNDPNVLNEVLNEENGLYSIVNKCKKSQTIEPATIFKIPVEKSRSVNEQLQENSGDNIYGDIDKDSLFLLPGAYENMNLDNLLSQGFNVAPDNMLRHLFAAIPNIIHNVLRRTAAVSNIDYVFVDLSPSIGLLNSTILFTSDSFIMPCNADEFSVDALKSVPDFLVSENPDSPLQKFNTWRSTAQSWIEKEVLEHSAGGVFKNSKESGYFETIPVTHCVQFAGVLVTRFAYNRVLENTNYDPTSPANFTNTLYRFSPQSNRLRDQLRRVKDFTLQMVGLSVSENRSLNSEMLHAMSQHSNPESYVYLGELPEFHSIGLISTRQSIPVPYLPTRFFKKKNPSSNQYEPLPEREMLSFQRLRCHHRQIFEGLIDHLIKNVFPHCSY